MTDPPRTDADATGTVLAPEPGGIGPTHMLGGGALPAQPTDLLYEQGLELKARGQWWYAQHRFFRHRLAMLGLVILFVIFGVGIFAGHIAPYSYSDINISAITRCSGPCAPTLAGQHYFGTDQVGRDYFSRVIWGIRTTERVALLVGFLSTLIGTTIGAFAGYFGGWIDNLLMRMTDLFLTIPLLAVLLTAAKLLGAATPFKVAVLLALFIWTPIARIVRGSFLSLREKEYVEAAKASGSGDVRIMVRHMLPNTIGPILVAATLTTGLAILLESTLSFLGFGIQPPTPSLGSLTADGESAGLNLWWLVTFPGLTIVLIVLCINFLGDGLRDALDPTQRRVRA